MFERLNASYSCPNKGTACGNTMSCLNIRTPRQAYFCNFHAGNVHIIQKVTGITKYPDALRYDNS